jgi:hypothetical protein
MPRSAPHAELNPGDGSSIDSTTATLTVTDDRRLEGNETVNLFIDTLSSTLDGHVSLSDTTHTATILDNETGVINFLADQSNAESVTYGESNVDDHSIRDRHDRARQGFTVTATQAAGSTATSGSDYGPFGPAILTFAAGDGTTIDSSTAILDVIDDRRLEGNETVNLSIGSLSSTLNGQVSLGDTTQTATSSTTKPA